MVECCKSAVARPIAIEAWSTAICPFAIKGETTSVPEAI